MEPTLKAPETITDVNGRSLMKAVTRALGFEAVPYSGRVRIVDDSLVSVLYERVRGGSLPDDVVGFLDTDANILYIARSKATPALRKQVTAMVRSHSARNAPAKHHPVSQAVQLLRDALARHPNGTHTIKAQRVLEQTGDFKKLREMVDNGAFGETPQVKEAAQRVLQSVRKRLVDSVLANVQQIIERRFPGVKLTLKEPGKIGFRSDRDVTLQPEGRDVPDSDLIRASLEAVNETYHELNRRGLPPDKALDSNFYTELREGSVKPASAAEARAIAFDQSVASLAEMRMQMSRPQWKKYKREQMEKLGKGKDTGGWGKAPDMQAQARMEEQFLRAAQLFHDLGGNSASTREINLGKLRRELLQTLKAASPKSARQIRDLMAKIKLLEPDAYGARAAVESVVDTQQELNQATNRKKIRDVRYKRARAMLVKSRSEALAAWAQEASASLGKMFSHAARSGANTSTEVRSLAKYLGRIFHAFREAGFHIAHPLIDRAGTIVGAQGEADSHAATMQELRAWALDTSRMPLTDADLIEAYIAGAQELGQELVARLRAAELSAHALDHPGEISPEAGTF